MQPEQPTEPNEPKPTGEEPEEPAPSTKARQDPGIHRELWAGTRLSRTVAVILAQGALWFNLFVFSQSTFTGLYVIVPSAITVIGITYVLISVTRFSSMPEKALMLLFGFALLVGNFSILYWNYGTTGNFTEHLTRLDAVYFAIGTLTTAGTGNVSAVSQLARGLQALQMALDIGFLVFVVALAVAEIFSRMQRRRDRQEN
jgi:Ion channel